MKIQKPKFTEPCNGCGLCCQLELCHLALIVFPAAEAPCPGLVEHEGRHRCALVLAERTSGAEPLLQRALGIDTGCSMTDDETTIEEWDAFHSIASREVVAKYPIAKPDGPFVMDELVEKHVREIQP